MNRHPVPDQEAARTLGRALRAVGYTEAAVHELLGDEAYAGDRDDVPIDERRLPEAPLATVVRAFFLQLPVSTSAAVRALGEPGVEALAATALAEVDDEVVLQARILPIEKVLLTSDGYSRDAEDPPDYVATYTPTARVCDSLTPRPRVRRAVDVGTGRRIQRPDELARQGHDARDLQGRAAHGNGVRSRREEPCGRAGRQRKDPGRAARFGTWSDRRGRVGQPRRRIRGVQRHAAPRRRHTDWRRDVARNPQAHHHRRPGDRRLPKDRQRPRRHLHDEGASEAHR